MSQESVIQRGIEAANNLVMHEIVPISREEAVQKSLALIERCEIAMVGSHGNDGYPNIKAMFKYDTQGLKTAIFSTNTSSRRVAQFKANAKACIYYYDPDLFMGVNLVGEMEIVEDLAVKEHLWRDGWEAYYPLGVMDPEYCLLRFTAKSGNYYHGLQNISFEI